MIVAEGMSLDAGPELIAERLLDALGQPFDLSAENRLTVTASVGIATGDRVGLKSCCATRTSRCIG